MPRVNDSTSVEIVNREHWLTEVARSAEPFFREFRIGPYRVTCGWPCKMGLGRRSRRVGECHYPLGSPVCVSGAVDAAGTVEGPPPPPRGYHEIFVSPLLGDPLDVAGTVCHELAHVAAGKDAGHGPGYVRVCKRVGLTKGKPTSASPGKLLEDKLRKVVERLGPYPHVPIVPQWKEVARPVRNVKCECGSCGCVVRIAVEWVGKAGLPHCGCGAGEMTLKDTRVGENGE